MRRANKSQTLRWSAEADRFDSVGIFVQLNYEEGVPQCIIKGKEGEDEKKKSNTNRQPQHSTTPAKRLSGLEVVQQDVQALRLLAVVLDDDTRASDDLSGVTLSVDLGQTGPGTQDLGVGDLDEVDVVLGAKSLDQLDVLGWESVLAGVRMPECDTCSPSVQVSTKTHKWACRLSKALAHSRRPRARPSWIKAF